MMNLGIPYEQLTPVMGDIRVGTVTYDSKNPQHRPVLAEALPKFLGSEGAVHGISYPEEHINAVLAAANAGHIVINFPVVALELCRPMVAGIMTEVPTFGIEADLNNNLHIVPYLHAEDTSLDLDIAKAFRDYTRALCGRDGLGLGTLLVKQRLLDLAQNDPSWVYGGRENEYAGDNPPIIGLMSKFGASLGTANDSPVLQFEGPMNHLKKNSFIDAITEALPMDATGTRLSNNNIVTRWTSHDGKQQIVMIDTLKYSTFNGVPTVWTKIKSNGLLPQGRYLQDILATMLLNSRDKMEDRQWGETLTSPHSREDGGFRNTLGLAIPTRLIHINKEQEIAQALKHMGAASRTFGSKPMLSGITSVKNIPNQEALFGKPLPEATRISSIDPVSEVQKPLFDLTPDLKDILTQGFSPMRPFLLPENDNNAQLKLRAA